MSSIIIETDQQMLADYKMYDAWQFLMNIDKNIATAGYCRYVIKKLIEHIEVKQKAYYNNMEEILQKDGTYSWNGEMDTSIEILGDSMDSYFLIDKYIKDFMQYSRNAFDSMAQFINKTILFSNPIDIERVDFGKVYNQLKNIDNQSKIFKVVEKIKTSDNFRYISEFNNKVKHIADTKVVIALDLLGVGVESKVNPFYKRGESFKEKEINSLIGSLYTFVFDELAVLLDCIRQEVPINNMKDKRIHTIEFEAQQIEGDPQNSFFNIFIRAEKLDELPEEIEFLFVNDYTSEGKFETKNFPYDELFIRNSDNMYLGKFNAVECYDESKDLIHYRKFSKQKFERPTRYVQYKNQSASVLKIYPGYMTGEIIKA
ncbi:hypothetical protein [Bacillus cereus group sp. MYBK69-1]|uniref:hypothetical protein n=1 Tax=unclassified Bacillus cereus group TaxID=2750818 RepID=UPI003F795B16